MTLLHVQPACIPKWDNLYGGWGAKDIDHTWIFKTGGTSPAPLAALDQVSLA